MLCLKTRTLNQCLADDGLYAILKVTFDGTQFSEVAGVDEASRCCSSAASSAAAPCPSIPLLVDKFHNHVQPIGIFCFLLHE